MRKLFCICVTNPNSFTIGQVQCLLNFLRISIYHQSFARGTISSTGKRNTVYKQTAKENEIQFSHSPTSHMFSNTPAVSYL